MALLEITKLRKSFGSVTVTNNLDLAVEAQERRVVIGPNGAGKTSLVGQICGQLQPDSGTIQFKGRNIVGLPPFQIARLGLSRTFQINSLFPALSVFENIRLAVQARRAKPSDIFRSVSRLAEIKERAERIVEQTALSGHSGRWVNALSYGEMRQLEIAVALAGEPELLLLDEPTAGMSPNETERIIDLILSLPRTITVLMIEHDMDVVFSVADSITVLSFGEVVVTGAPQEVVKNAKVQEIYLGMV